MPDAILFFAAGFGTRMRPLTDTRPKPLVPLGGRPMIDHALGLAEAAGIERKVANAHYLADQVAAYLEPKGVRISHEHGRILDTGGGLRAARPLLGAGPVFTMNTDAIWQGPNPLSLLRAAWRPEEMDALLMLIPPAQAVGHAGTGDFHRDAQGRLRRGPGAIYGGAQIIKPELTEEVTEPAFSLNRVWDRLIGDGRLHGISYPGRWCDIGTPEGLRRAEAVLAEDGDV